MSRRRRNQNQNFDSLLDTMANVVGVLIVVLAITQMHVGEAVRRIQLAEPTEDPVESPEGFVAVIPSMRVAFGREVRRIERDLRRLDAPTSAIEDRAGAIATRLARIDSLPIPFNQLASPDEELLAEIQAAHVRMLEQEEEQARLEQSALVLEMRLGELEGLSQAVAHKVRLPDPRPAPFAATELPFFVRNGRVAEADIEELTRTLNRAIRDSTNTDFPDDPFSSSRLVTYFKRRDVGDESYRWELSSISGYRILARLVWRNDEVGEEDGIFNGARSDFRQTLMRRDTRTRYVLFHVWNDSFPAYLRAREIAEGLGFSVGWKIYEADEEFEGVLTTGANPKSAVPVD